MRTSFIARSAVERVLLSGGVLLSLWMVVGWAVAVP